MTRQQQIERRLDEILTQWMGANPDQRGLLVLERIRLQDELDRLRS